MQRPLGLASFDHQSRLIHVLTALGGVVVFWLAYAGAVVAVYGDLSVVGPETAIGEQRVGALAGGVAVWTYFGLAFVRAKGGPVLDALVYPFAIVAGVSHGGRWLLFGFDAGDAFDRFIGILVFEPLLTTAVAVIPGLGAFVTILTIWAWLIGEEDRREWERCHLTEAFYREYVAQEYD